MKDCKIALFSDASFADDLAKSKSTTGAYLVLVGPKTYVPLSWMCKKQGAVSHSSTEAEIIALDAMIRLEGLPGLHLWSQVVETMSQSKVACRKAGKPEESGLHDLPINP